MSDLLAHLLLFLRRPGACIRLFGITYQYCTHRSHRHGWRCRRWYVYDGQCAHHNRTCYTDCPRDT